MLRLMDKMGREVFLCFVVYLGAAFSEPPPDFKSKVDEFAEKVLSCRDMVGLNLAVVEGENTVLTEGYGLVDLARQDKVNHETVFGIASLTKAFASTALAAVMDDSSSFSWDSTTREVFGEEFYFHDKERSKYSTLRDLVSHKMGLSPNNYARLQGGLTREILASKIRYFEATQPYRESYWYNNLMYGLISYATEIIGGKNWEEVLQEKIFSPLSMSSTTFSYVTNLSRPDIAIPYSYSEDQWRAVSLKLYSEWGSLGGSGAVMTNAVDMANWLKFNLNSYGTENSSTSRDILSPGSKEELYTSENIIPESDSAKLYRKPYCPVSYVTHSYAKGWRTGSYRGYPMIMHTGTSWGDGAHLILLPDKKIGVYSSITGLDLGYHGRRALHMYIIDLLLGETPWHNLTTACTYPTSTSKQSKQVIKHIAASPLSDYIGTYGNYGYGNLTITKSGDALKMTYGTLGKWDLLPTAVENEFTGQGIDDVWNIKLNGILFKSVGGRFEEVIVETFNPSLPPVFTRDLKMNSSPEPLPLDCTVSSANYVIPMYVYILFSSVAVNKGSHYTYSY